MKFLTFCERKFGLKDRDTTIVTELVAGLTTFITMAYILALIPNVLSVVGIDQNSLFLATCLVVGLASILAGVFSNLPIALAPGIGLCAYFVSIAMQQNEISWQIALGLAFIANIIFFILTITGVGRLLVESVPSSLKHAITVGIGLFIALVGLKNSGLVTLNLHLGPSMFDIVKGRGTGFPMFFEWDLSLGIMTNPEIVLTLFGLMVTGILIAFRVRGAILLGILAATIMGIPMGLTDFSSISFNLPSFSNLQFGMFNLKDIWKAEYISIIFTFVFVGLMDIFGSLISVTNRAGLLKDEGRSIPVERAMSVGSAMSIFSSYFGIPSITTYLESVAGISVGGRTGLTAIVIGLLFLLSLFLGPIFKIIPAPAFAPVLIIVGTFMISSIKNINFEDFSEALPAFLTIMLMPLTYNVGHGISAGIVFYTVMNAITGKYKELHWMLYLLTVLIILRFIFLV